MLKRFVGILVIVGFIALSVNYTGALYAGTHNTQPIASETQVSPIAIAALSIILPGVGHLLMGDMAGGTVWLFSYAALFIILGFAVLFTGGLALPCCILLPVLGFAAAVDAYREAKSMNEEK